MYRKNIDTINSNSFKFLKLKNSIEFAKLLHFEFYNFQSIIKNASYREFSIPKAKGGKRSIEAPNENLLFIQKKLNSYLQDVYYKIKPDQIQDGQYELLG